MGYSSRYHAASLAAVFLALAVGILIGVGFGSDIVTGTAADLESSLASDLDEARTEADELEARLEAERSFSAEVYPAVVEGDLEGDRVALVGLGGLEQPLAEEVAAAIEPAGADLTAVAVVRMPPDLDALAATLEGRRARSLSRGDEAELRAFGERAGRRLVRGGDAFDAIRGVVFSRFSGAAGDVDSVVVVRRRPTDLEPGQEVTTDLLERGLIDGLAGTADPVVGAEESTDEPSSIPFFDDRDLPSVDSIDRVSGRVALVYALAGAAGNYGIKDTAEGLLPDLLPAASSREGQASR